VPYGTDSRLNGFQAINCLATIIQSLRDGIFGNAVPGISCLDFGELGRVATIVQSLQDNTHAPNVARCVSYTCIILLFSGVIIMFP
jgi:hypothetical protein